MAVRAHEHDQRLGDVLVDLYVDWREECSAVQLAYERWRTAPKDECGIAFAAYNAALDREERASEIYAAVIRQAAPARPESA